MTDIFEEIEEQLRSERYSTLFRKYWRWVLGLAIVALAAALAYWGYDAWRKDQAAKASEAYAVGVDDLRQGQNDKAFADFAKVASGGPKGYRALALMQQGGIRLDQNRTQEAVALFDKAASAAPDAVIGDMARLKSAFALMDTAAYPAIEERLKPLIDAKRPFHAVAREALAVSKLKAGKVKDARDDFTVLRLMADAPDGVRQRAQLAIAAIDSGSAADLATTVKAALAAPPPAAAPVLPNLPQSGAGQ